jgi:phosphate butyryltransferase
MTAAKAQAWITNRTFDEIAIGDSASLSRSVSLEDVQLFAFLSGDVNPAHLDPEYAKTDIFHRVIVHGLWGAGLISAVLGVELPGPGTVYLDQTLKFLHPVDIGDTITAMVTVTERRPDRHILHLACTCANQRGEVVISGEAVVLAPTEKVRRPRPKLPEVQLQATPEPPAATEETT